MNYLRRRRGVGFGARSVRDEYFYSTRYFMGDMEAVNTVSEVSF